MFKFLRCILILFLAVTAKPGYTQAPFITYSSPQTLTVSIGIKAIKPLNLGGPVPATVYSQVTTFAGNGDFSSIDGTGTAASFNGPYGVNIDPQGNILVTEGGHIRKITPGGVTSTLAVNGSVLKFNQPTGLATDAQGNIFLDEWGNNRVLKITPANAVTIFGIQQLTDTTFRPAVIGYPEGVATDPAGNVYVTPNIANIVLKISPGGTISLLAGSGQSGSKDGTGNGATFYFPSGLALDAGNNVYVGDSGNGLIRKITPGGVTSTISNIGNGIEGLASDAAGNIYVAVAGDRNLIVKIDPAGITTILAGQENEPFSTDGVGTNAVFASPYGIANDGIGNLYVADNYDNRIRKICITGYSISPALPAGLIFDATTGTISGTPTAASPATNYTITAYNLAGSSTAIINLKVVPLTPPVISYNSPQIYTEGIAISPLSPTSILVAALGYKAPVILSSSLGDPFGVSADVAGNLYVAATGNGVVTKIAAGTATHITWGGNGNFNSPTGTAIDAAGNIYVADYGHNAVKKILTDGVTVATVASGFNGPIAVAVDKAGNVYVADRLNNAIKEIPAGGGPIITLGSGFSGPTGVAVDLAGNLYVADAGNNAVKMIPVAGGAPVVIGSGFNVPVGVSVDKAGNILVVDQLNNAVKEILAGSGTTVTIGTGFNKPGGVTTDGAGNIYIADQNNNSVDKMVPVGGYFINANLPLGLNFNQNTGVISGTPVSLSPATTYTVTAYNAAGGGSATVNMTVKASANANLAGLTLSAGSLKPAFSTATTGYVVAVGNGIASITVTPTTSDATATVTVNGAPVTSGSASGAIPLNAGPNTITTIVTAQDGVTMQTYTVTVTRAPSTNAKLLSLTTSAGVVSPAFSNTVTSYTRAVANTVNSVTLTPATVDPTATITVNGAPTSSGTASAAIPLNVGANTISTVVTAQYGTTKITYTITVTRAPSADATLSNITISPGTIKPAFTSANTAYTVAVGNGITSVTITPITTDPGATIKIGAKTGTSGTASDPIALAVGANTIAVVITAQNGVTTKNYKITVTRAPSTNAKLLSLTTSSGAVSPAFNNAITSYTRAVPNSVTSITFKPTVVDKTANITVNGTTTASNTSSTAQPLVVGANTENIVVTAQDGKTTITYTVTITRAMGGANSVYEPVSVEKPLDNPRLAADNINVHGGVSPNGDGINDFLVIENIANYPDNTLRVMNRSGQLVFEANGYDNSSKVFDGHSNKTGAMQLPGTYFYSLDYTVKGVARHKTGFIVLKY